MSGSLTDSIDHCVWFYDNTMWFYYYSSLVETEIRDVGISDRFFFLAFWIVFTMLVCLFVVFCPYKCEN